MPPAARAITHNTPIAASARPAQGNTWGAYRDSVATAPNWAYASLTNSRATELGALWPGVSADARRTRQAASGTKLVVARTAPRLRVKGVQSPAVEARRPPGATASNVLRDYAASRPASQQQRSQSTKSSTMSASCLST